MNNSMERSNLEIAEDILIKRWPKPYLDERGYLINAIKEALDAKDLLIQEANKCRICGGTDAVCAKAWADEKKMLQAELAVERKRVEELKSERTRLYSVLKDLHETTCPYKPFATIPHHEEHEDAPKCTCSEQKKTRYWAVQDFLHRGEISMLSSHLSVLKEALVYILNCNIHSGSEALAFQSKAEAALRKVSECTK